jgi:hypothetical protein
MNKVKIGDRVQLTAKAHTWHVKHLNDNFLRPGSTELEKENYEEAALLYGSKSRRTKLKGTAVNYGAPDSDFKCKRAYIRVEFQWNGLKCDFYCSEKDLKRL